MSDAGPGPSRLPPVHVLGIVALAVVIVGGIYLAANLPRQPPLWPAAVALGLAAVLMAISLASLARVRGFAWRPFFMVGKWALAAYVVVAGMLEYIFVLDGTRGSTLVIRTLMLVAFGITVPMLLAFSVARYQQS